MANNLEYEFSPVGYDHSLIHLAGRVCSAFVFTSAFQLMYVSRSLTMSLTKIPPARAK